MKDKNINKSSLPSINTKYEFQNEGNRNEKLIKKY